MGGVDRNDQLREYYHIRLKSQKYYKCLFWMQFDVSISNSLVIAKTNSNLHSNTRNVKSFRTALAHQLLEGYCSRKTKGRRSNVTCTKRFRRALSSTRRREATSVSLLFTWHQKDTKWHCKDCNLYLCHKGYDTDCFFAYHKNYV